MAGAWTQQSRLVYLPGDAPGEPAAAGLAAAWEVELETEDGLRLAAWYLPPPGRQPAAAVLVCNGNAGSRADRAPLAAALADLGLGVLLLDYRGYGGNPGVPSEQGLAADARAGRAWLSAQPEVDDARLVLYGESLGAAVAARIAAEDPPAALVLRSPFTSLRDVGRLHYGPLALLLRERYPVRDLVSAVEAPVLVVAGDADRLVPPAQSRAVAEAAGARFVSVPRAGHNDRALLDGPILMQAIDDLVR